MGLEETQTRHIGNLDKAERLKHNTTGPLELETAIVGSSVRSKNIFFLERILTSAFACCQDQQPHDVYATYLYIYTYIIKISRSPNDLLRLLCSTRHQSLLSDTAPRCPELAMPKHQAKSRCPSDAWNRRQNAKLLSALVPSPLGNKLLGASALLVFRI